MNEAGAQHETGDASTSSGGRRWLRVALISLVVLVVAGVGAVMVMTRMAEPVAAGLDGPELGSCEEGVEDCVHSRASEDPHAIMPLVCPDATFNEVVEAAQTMIDGTTLETLEGDYAHLVTRRQLLGFAHDLELRGFGSIVDVRAQSRTDWFGGSDNRERVEEFRAALIEAGTCTA